MKTLFDTCTIGKLELGNRVAMAPMTRVRASASGVPAQSAALYYAQRASAGLIVSERSFRGHSAVVSQLGPVGERDGGRGWRGALVATTRAQ